MINKKALVIGYGSIGNRHVNILKSNNTITDVSILSDQKGLPFQTINNLDAIQKIDPDYIVIASETSSHFKILNYLEENFNNKVLTCVLLTILPWTINGFVHSFILSSLGYNLPIIFILFAIFLTVNTILEAPRDAAIGTGIILAGLPLYYYWKKND